MLLLRALYDRFAKMRDRNSVGLHDDIAACIWKSDDYGNLDMTEEGLKIKSEVASDNDKGEFLQILRDGKANPAWKSSYAKNFRYFQGKIAELAENYDGYSAPFASRIMRHVIGHGAAHILDAERPRAPALRRRHLQEPALQALLQ